MHINDRVRVTTADGSMHTGVVTGLRGQGMADLRLDSGRCIRQPVSALTLLTTTRAKPNGRHARRNASTDTLAQLQRVPRRSLQGLVNEFYSYVQQDDEYASRLGFVARDTAKQAAIQAKRQDVVQARAAAIRAEEELKHSSYSTRTPEYKQLKEARDEAILVMQSADRSLSALLVVGELQEGSAMYNNALMALAKALEEDQTLADVWRTSTDPTVAARDLIEEISARKSELLAARGMSVQRTDNAAAQAAAARAARRDQAVPIRAALEQQAGATLAERTDKDRAHREQVKQIGGVSLEDAVARKKVAYRIIPDPLRVSNTGANFCGNTLDGQAYMLIATAEQRMVTHWLTWQDIGISDDGNVGTSKYSYTPLSDRRAAREERPTPMSLSVDQLLNAVAGDDGVLRERFASVPVTTGSQRAILTRRQLGRLDKDSGVVNREFDIFDLDADSTPLLLVDLCEQYDLVPVVIKPMPARVRAGSQTGSLYTRKSLPPEAPRAVPLAARRAFSARVGNKLPPGVVQYTFTSDAPILFRQRGETTNPDVFGFSTEVRVETATALLDLFQPFTSYDAKGQSPYYSWVPEVPGQFSALAAAAPRARPCADPELLPALNAVQQTAQSFRRLQSKSRALHDVFTRDNGVHTLQSASAPLIKRALRDVIQAASGVAYADVRIKERQRSVAARKRLSTDYTVFSDPKLVLSQIPDDATREDAKRGLDLMATVADLIRTRLRLQRFVQESLVEGPDNQTKTEFTPVDTDAYLASLKRLIDGVVREDSKTGSFMLAPEYRQRPDAPLQLLFGLMYKGESFPDILWQLSHDDVALAMSIYTSPEDLAKVDTAKAQDVLDLLRDSHAIMHGRPSRHSDATALWGSSEVRSALRAMTRHVLKTYLNSSLSAHKDLFDAFSDTLSYLAWREENNYSNGNDATEPEAALALYIYVMSRFSSPLLGGPLTLFRADVSEGRRARGNGAGFQPRAPRPARGARHSQARINGRGGSTETDDMQRAAAKRGYVVAPAATPESRAEAEAAAAALRGMGRVERRALGRAVTETRTVAPENKPKATTAALQEQAEARQFVHDRGDSRGIGDQAMQTAEILRNALVGGGSVREVAYGTKVYYTYNPLLFELTRLYYNAFAHENDVKRKFLGWSNPMKKVDGKPEANQLAQLREMIDWIGTYGELLKIVRESTLVFAQKYGESASSLADFREGFVELMAKAPLNQKKQVPQRWVELCPLAFLRLKLSANWDLKYKQIKDDEDGAVLESTVLMVKGQAIEGLNYAGQMARRGLVPAAPAHGPRSPEAVALAKPADLRLSSTDAPADDSRLYALATKLTALAPVFVDVAERMPPDDKIRAQYLSFWHDIQLQSKRLDPLLSTVQNDRIPLSLGMVYALPLLGKLNLVPAEDRLALRIAFADRKDPRKLADRIVLSGKIVSTFMRSISRLEMATSATPPHLSETAPRVEPVQQIVVTAADKAAIPTESFLSKSRDREILRRQLLDVVDQRLSATR